MNQAEGWDGVFSMAHLMYARNMHMEWKSFVVLLLNHRLNKKDMVECTGYSIPMHKFCRGHSAPNLRFSEKKLPTKSFDYVHPHLLLATTPA